MGNVIPYKQWLIAKRRRACGSWDCEQPLKPMDGMEFPDVVHSAQFKARFAELIGMGTNPVQTEAPIRGRAVSCDVNIVDNSGLAPKGED